MSICQPRTKISLVKIIYSLEWNLTDHKIYLAIVIVNFELI